MFLVTGSAFTRLAEPSPTTERETELWRTLQQVIGSLNGDAAWQRLWNVTGVTDATHYAVTIFNNGAGGHLNVPGIFSVSPSGVQIGILSLTNLTVSGTLGVTGVSTLGVVNSGALTSSSTVQGTRLISTVATGTSPLTVASTTVVANLNADMVDGLHAASFLTTTTGDARYLQLTGGVIAGNFQVTGSSIFGSIGAGATTVTSFTATGAAAFDSTVALGNSNTDAVTIPGTLLVGSQTLWADGANNRVGIGTNTPSALHVFDVNGDVNFQDTLAVGDGITNTSGTVKFSNSGNARIETNATGLGLLGATPIARPSVVGVRTGTLAQLQTVVANLLSALDGSHLGAITDLTT